MLIFIFRKKEEGHKPFQITIKAPNNICNNYFTYLLTINISQHVDVIRRRLDLVPRQKFTQVFRRHTWTPFRLTKGKTIIITRNLSLGGRKCINFERNFSTFFEGFWVNTGEIKGGSRTTQEAQGGEAPPKES